MNGPGPIGRDAAQRLARDELSKAVYHQPESLPARIVHAVGGLLARLFADAAGASPGGWWTIVALAALLVAAAGVVAVRLGPLARSGRRAGGRAWDPGPRAMTARELRDASAASAAAGDYSAAILNRVRAVVVSCEERGVLTADAGRTANEVAAQAGARFPAQRAGLMEAARSFDQVRYGGAAGTRDGYERLCALDAALAAVSPAVAPA